MSRALRCLPARRACATSPGTSRCGGRVMAPRRPRQRSIQPTPGPVALAHCLAGQPRSRLRKPGVTYGKPSRQPCRRRRMHHRRGPRHHRLLRQRTAALPRSSLRPAQRLCTRIPTPLGPPARPGGRPQWCGTTNERTSGHRAGRRRRCLRLRRLPRHSHTQCLRPIRWRDRRRARNLRHRRPKRRDCRCSSRSPSFGRHRLPRP